MSLQRLTQPSHMKLGGGPATRFDVLSTGSPQKEQWAPRVELPSSAVRRAIASLQTTTHSSQMYTPAPSLPAPITSFLTSFCRFPQKEQLCSFPTGHLQKLPVLAFTTRVLPANAAGQPSSFCAAAVEGTKSLARVRAHRNPSTQATASVTSGVTAHTGATCICKE